MNGPEFLRIFWLVEIASLGVASCARKIVLNWTEIDPQYASGPETPENEKYRVDEFDVYEIALLKGGTKHAFLTAVKTLEKLSLATVDRTKNTMTKISNLIQIAHRNRQSFLCGATSSR
jgi:hypothetical protein